MRYSFLIIGLCAQASPLLVTVWYTLPLVLEGHPQDPLRQGGLGVVALVAQSFVLQAVPALVCRRDYVVVAFSVGERFASSAVRFACSRPFATALHDAGALYRWGTDAIAGPLGMMRLAGKAA